MEIRPRVEKERMGGIRESLAGQANMDIRRGRVNGRKSNRKKKMPRISSTRMQRRAGKLKSAFDKRANECLV